MIKLNPYPKKFSKIHRKTPVPESLFNKVTGLRPTTSLKKNRRKIK